jgi:hypothetical protein
MKKINPSSVTGGMPITTDDLRTVFNDEIWDATEALLSPFSADTQGIIVSGCTLTPNGGNWDISAGIVYLNGEFMRLTAATNQALPKYIAPAAPVNDNRTFADTTTKTAFITKAAELVGSAPGAGQYVAITSSTDPDDRRLINIIVNRQLAAVFQSTLEALGGFRTEGSGPYLKTKVVNIGDWDMDTDDTKLVPHGLTESKIRAVLDVAIIDDNGNLYPLRRVDTSTGNVDGGIVSYGAGGTDMSLWRRTSGLFDTANFNQTSFNRGYITIQYEP